MHYLNFALYHGRNEQSYSKAVAQTLALSDEFRKKFLELLLSTANSPGNIKEFIDDDIHSITLEKDFGTFGRMDVVIETVSGLIIGIENKKWAGLQQNQLSRYAEAFEQIGQPYFLVFLTPKLYALSENERPKSIISGNFTHITYDNLLSIAIALSNNENSLEHNYFSGLSKFLEGLAMPPINIDEINSMKYYYRAKEKLINVLMEIKTEKGKIEDNPNYMLTARWIGKHLVFSGFRFGTNWYFNAPLLNNEPEIICYAKDTLPNILEATPQNDILQKFYSDEFKTLQTLFNCEVDYYPRKRPNECRLAIRKRLNDFNGKELSEMMKWLNDVIDYLSMRLSPDCTFVSTEDQSNPEVIADNVDSLNMK